MCQDTTNAPQKSSYSITSSALARSVGHDAVLNQRRTLLNGDQLRFREVLKSSCTVAGLQPQQAAQAAKLASGPALAGLDLLNDTGECREPFLRTACIRSMPCCARRKPFSTIPRRMSATPASRSACGRQ
jgi:hypothetical protein